MAQLLYQGHASFRIVSEDGTVIYIDPYVGEGYDLPADLILVTHEHSDHNKVSIVPQKQGARIIRASDALKNGKYASFQIGGVKLEAVEACNRNHKKEECVGFLLTVDGATLYHAGDTSETGRMKELAARALDWALLPVDGVYNMDADEASRCAALIGAKHSVPIHTAPGRLFDAKTAEAFHCPGRVIMRPGETAAL
ncbi:hypothetical protein SDC9_124376 [bioreactor metagenome]|uniref:Metallo-beta-lactamase domain-containing protein n=1 Tax=bioreactor metagenome TaxID=1076179 RepID=A0A645CKC0_9ZZZZ